VLQEPREGEVPEEDAVRHVYVVSAPHEYIHAGEETGLVHYEGCGLIGSHTLCGHTDWVGSVWDETKKRVNCKACIAVRDHVFGR
jgi:hypothetical protein